MAKLGKDLSQRNNLREFNYDRALSYDKKLLVEQVRLIGKKKVNFELPIVIVYPNSASELKRGLSIMKAIEAKL